MISAADKIEGAPGGEVRRLMILKCTSFEEMQREITEQDMSIVIWGAGVIGTVTTPEILRQHGLLRRIAFYIDKNPEMHGCSITVYNREVEIKAVDALNAAGGNTVLIIAVSRYAEVLNQLEHMERTAELICYLMPMMCIHNFCGGVSEGMPTLSDKPLIPKKIHYMWLGKKQIPAKLQKCIDSWKRYCPDYEIIQWNEDNYDVDKHPYMRDAYEQGAYGFVPDYARLDILYRYGGLYMDTDVEVRKNLDPLLYQEAFCGVEKWQIINFGGCSGAVKGHPMMEKFIEAREGISFLDKNGRKNTLTCGYYDTNVALENGYCINGKTQYIQGMNIYASDYFHPFDYMSGHMDMTKHTYSVHWFNGGWLDEGMRRANEDAMRRFDRVYAKAVGKSEKIEIPAGIS